MNSLTLVTLTPAQTIFHALGWTLLHFLWQGTLIALILACVLSLLSQRSPQPRYLAACTALLLMVTLPVVTFTRIMMAPPSPAQAINFFVTPEGAINGYGAAALHQPLLKRIAETLDRSMPEILAVWFVGVALLLARLSAGLIVARRMKSVAAQPPPRDLLATFQQLAHRIGVFRPVRLLSSAFVQAPTVIGWLRPVVLIPFGCLSGLSPLQLEAILAHELAHIRRHDYLISVLQSVVEALLFYHPAVWWVSQNIRTEREHCCDDLAVRVGGDVLTYVRALSLLAEQSLALPTIALGANGGRLTMRIKRLLGTTENPATSQLAAITLVAIIVAITGLGIGTKARAQQNPTGHPTTTIAVLTEDRRGPVSNSNAAVSNPQAPANQTAPHIAQPYLNWIDEDVRWNITPPERTAFLQLQSDAERDHFIEQFWLRNDPAGSPRFTFREEHYRRIAYANQHFAAGAAGWQTDRGHVYIVYGQPSTIDSHPAAYGEAHPYETWRYSSAPGLGQNVELKFVDTCNCGNYQLQSPSAQVETTASPNFSQRAPTPASARSAPKPSIHQVSYKLPASVPPSIQLEPSTPPLHVAQGSMRGNLIFKVDPVYPAEAKAHHIQGAVVLNAII